MPWFETCKNTQGTKWMPGWESSHSDKNTKEPSVMPWLAALVETDQKELARANYKIKIERNFSRSLL